MELIVRFPCFWSSTLRLWPGVRFRSFPDVRADGSLPRLHRVQRHLGSLCRPCKQDCLSPNEPTNNLLFFLRFKTQEKFMVEPYNTTMAGTHTVTVAPCIPNKLRNNIMQLTAHGMGTVLVPQAKLLSVSRFALFCFFSYLI